MQGGDTQSEVRAIQGPCPLCGAALAAADSRCPSCGLSLSGVYGRPGPFSQTTFWWLAGGLGLVYLLTLLIVALAR
ncbi:MAG: hypothetical protein ACRDWD_07410 [Acidimicrobiia bacterium]